ncbi:hypothetical protein KFK09_026053 [Dendrobium nobile]|uniref:E3 ubiquitin-protein ligase n=1 Tax=Dendrobium nobile TaxID=94219 RepID=A0A8T3A7J8_DENNO|nr:hypothetical protein KFK09_026053 [Dendrobium nobile]
MAAGSSLEEQCESQTDRYPLLMEQPVNGNADEHVIDVVRGSASSTSVVHGNGDNEDRSSTTTNAFAPQSSTSQTASNSRNASFNRGIDNYGRRNRSPLNSGIWISIELIVNLSQIIAAVVVLSFSRHENPQTPLFAWVIGYTVGCIATLPHLYWRYINRNRLATEQDATNSFRNISQNNAPESNSYTAISVAHAVEAESGHGSVGPCNLDVILLELLKAFGVGGGGGLMECVCYVFAFQKLSYSDWSILNEYISCCRLLASLKNKYG